MAEETKIQWCHHTFNGWRGCTKRGPECEYCYAETMSGRNPAVLGVWGKHGTRPIGADSYWRGPIAWNRAAEATMTRKRVFCGSLKDAFEGNDTMPESAHGPVYQARLRLVHLMKDTPWLDWMLLTKRAENIQPIAASLYPATQIDLLSLPNVWCGTSVGVRSRKDQIDFLREVPSAIRFLSIEPLLEDLGELNLKNIDLVIVGGESGANARPMHSDWARSVRDQCLAVCKDCRAEGAKWLRSTGPGFQDDVSHWGKCKRPAFFFKQWGNYWPFDPLYLSKEDHAFGPIPDDWDPQLEHHWPQNVKIGACPIISVNIGKEKAGRLLDGREWNEMPEVSL